MQTKEFSQELYDENDVKGKNEAIKFFSSLFDCSLKSDAEVYVYDFLMIDHFGKELSIEVERKKVWEGYKFPHYYKTFDLPFRKSKNTAEVIVIFNKDYSALGMIKMEIVKKSPIERKNTIYSKNEKFFKVQLCHVMFFELHDGKWYRDYKYNIDDENEKE